VVVGVYGGRPVYLRESRRSRMLPRNQTNTSFFGNGHARSDSAHEQPAVTLTVAKRPGANAISVANQVLKKIDALKGLTFPNDIGVSITRHYGNTAAEKSNELLLHMGIAVHRRVGLILLDAGLASRASWPSPSRPP